MYTIINYYNSINDESTSSERERNFFQGGDLLIDILLIDEQVDDCEFSIWLKRNFRKNRQTVMNNSEFMKNSDFSLNK